jgi:hypothetical protein
MKERDKRNENDLTRENNKNERDAVHENNKNNLKDTKSVHIDKLLEYVT